VQICLADAAANSFADLDLRIAAIKMVDHKIFSWGTGVPHSGQWSGLI